MGTQSGSFAAMKGDIIVLEEHHRQAAAIIVPTLVEQIAAMPSRFTMTVAGQSGSGKSETAQAISEQLADHGISAVVLGQDDYFVLPPKSNDARRRSDDEWLGPHVEVRLDLLEEHLVAAIEDADEIVKPLVDYDADSIGEEVVSLDGVQVVIAEGTYCSLLKHVDAKVYINRNRLDTLEHRQRRNRGTEVGDPFIENVLKIENMIIAGHRHLADFVITNDYEVIVVD